MSPKGDYESQSFEDRSGAMFDPANDQSTTLDVFKALAQAGQAPPSQQEEKPSKSEQVMDEMLQDWRQSKEEERGLRANQRELTTAQAGEMLRLGDEIGSMQPPQPQQLPKSPERNFGQGLSEYLGLMSLMAALAGGVARGNATVALNAFAGGMKGFAQGREQEFQDRVEEWKDASAKVREDNQARLDQYNAIWKNKKMNIDMKMAAMKMVAQQYQDEITYNAADRKDYTTLAGVLQRQEGIQQQAQLKQLQIEEHVINIQDKLAQRQTNMDGEADRFIDGIPGAGTGFARSPQMRAKWLETVDRRLQERGLTNEDIKRNKTQYAGETSYQRSGGTYANRVENATNEVQQLIPQALQASDALPRGKFVPWNKLRQQYQAGTSDPAYNDFVVANFGLLNAYLRAMNPSGQPRISERLEVHAEGILSQATSPQAYRTQVNRLWLEVQQSKKAVAQTRANPPSSYDPNAPVPPLPGPPPITPEGGEWSIER